MADTKDDDKHIPSISDLDGFAKKSWYGILEFIMGARNEITEHFVVVIELLVATGIMNL